VLAEAGRSRVVIYAPARLADAAAVAAGTAKPPRPKVKLTPAEKTAQKRARVAAQQLAAAVSDLGHYLSKLAAADVQIVWSPPPASAPNESVQLLIGELAESRFGRNFQTVPGQQGFRVTVTPSALGLYGASDLATSYAIYELLDRLGCRWFMPGALGEEIPRLDVVSLPLGDDSLAPSTLYRGLWFVDADFQRRNRLGGLHLAAGHMLERWITAEQRKQHPDWRAQVGGKPDDKRLRWSNPAVAPAIASAIASQVAEKPAESVSISPGDGVDFDEGADRELDAKDWDPTVNGVSVTDRLLVLANGVARALHARHPDLRLGLLAYANYTRPPVREEVHPNVVPVIAPITYCRPHPWSDDNCPGAREARRIVEGWSARSAALGFRGYGFNLAEPSAPFPMLRKWSFELPFLLAHKTSYFQPETLPNFETTLPGLYLALRLSWNKAQTPEAVLDELFTRFYGHASHQARAYWDLMDRAWTETPEYAGGALGYEHRFPPAFLAKARRAMNDTVKACVTDVERQRVAMLERSLSQLELFMKLEAALDSGNLAAIGSGFEQWLTEADRLSEKYAENAAFGKTRWAKGSAYAAYMRRFMGDIYQEAARILHDDRLLAVAPLCTARYRLAPQLELPAASPPVILDDADASTRFCSETWSAMGQHDYFGAMWYQADVELAPAMAGKRSFAWLSKLDGVAQVWLNGAPALPRDASPAGKLTAEAHAKSLTFELPAAALGKTNRVTIVIKRTKLVELGAGGLLGPVYFYAER